MRVFLGLVALAALSIQAPARAEEELRSRAAAALKRYYAERLRQPFIRFEKTPEAKENPPPWAAPVRQLSGAQAPERGLAAAYLRELVAQALEDERSGTAPWRATPYWGGGAENPARDLRKAVAGELAKAGPVPEALPVLRWYLITEPADNFLEPIMTALDKLDGKDADALRLELAGAPHENAVVAAAAINQLATRKRSVSAERLAALCHHHRAAIREAAGKLNAQQGGKDPGAFDAARAVRSEPVRKVMDQVLALMPELPPAKAEFVTATVRYLDDKKVVKETWDVQGWLIRRQGERVEVYTPYGRPETLVNGERKQVDHHEPLPEGNGVRISKIDITVDVSVAGGNVGDLVKRVVEARSKDRPADVLTERGPLTGQFRGSGATLYEAVLGAWLYRAGRYAEAARVLLPALDSLYRDRHLAEMVRQQLGEVVGYRMLAAFAGDRDYEKTLRQAKLVNELYPDTRFHRYAKGLAKQLPRRRDDFTKFKLPTPAEWAEMKKKMTRAQQIDFLCERLRLLNCFQVGQPGGYWPDEKQYAEPCGMAVNASWGLRKGKTEVINPLTELEGPRNGFDRDQPGPKGLGLTLADVPQLSKYLRDDWFMLIVTFWRDFHPGRSLSSTRPVFARIINDLAHKDLCKPEEWADRTPAGIDKEIERINRWAAQNAGKTDVQLERDALEEAVIAGARWHDVEGRVKVLLQEKQPEAYEVLKRYLQDEQTDPYSRARILEVYLENDVARAKDLAPKYLSAKDDDLRLQAALVVFRTGDRARVRSMLGDGLANREVGGWSVAAVEALLKDGSAGSRQQVRRLFSNRRLPHERHGVRVHVFRLCVEAGLKEPYDFYLSLLDVKQSELPMLDDEGKPSGVSYFQPTVAEEFAREIVGPFARGDPAVGQIAKKFPKTADQIPHLKEWLRTRLAAKN
jgi:hypothetical protein